MQIHDLKEAPIAAEIHGISDRASAIVATSYLDTKLTSAIKGQLVEDRDTLNKMFKPNGPLGPLGVKADIGFLLRIYSKETRNEIMTLAGIRNLFAHWEEPTTFGNRDIRLKCEVLTLPERVFGHIPGHEAIKRPFDEATAKKQFIESVSIASTFLNHAAKHPESFARI